MAEATALGRQLRLSYLTKGNYPSRYAHDKTQQNVPSLHRRRREAEAQGGPMTQVLLAVVRRRVADYIPPPALQPTACPLRLLPRPPAATVAAAATAQPALAADEGGAATLPAQPRSEPGASPARKEKLPRLRTFPPG